MYDCVIITCYRPVLVLMVFDTVPSLHHTSFLFDHVCVLCLHCRWSYPVSLASRKTVVRAGRKYSRINMHMCMCTYGGLMGHWAVSMEVVMIVVSY